MNKKRQTVYCVTGKYFGEGYSGPLDNMYRRCITLVVIAPSVTAALRGMEQNYRGFEADTVNVLRKDIDNVVVVSSDETAQPIGVR